MPIAGIMTEGRTYREAGRHRFDRLAGRHELRWTT